MPTSRKKTHLETPAPNKGLSITKQKQQVLSKPQQAFNRLVQKIEKLQQEIADDNRLLGEKLEYYGKHIYPVEQQMVALRKQMVKMLFPFYTAKKPLTKRDKHALKEILVMQLNNIFAFDRGKPDDELQEIFEAIEGMSLEEAAKQDMEMVKSQMTEMFESFGFRMSFDDLHPGMNEEEMIRKMQEMEEQFSGQAHNFNQRVRKKTKKQLEKEEREKQVAEIKNKSIGRIYKQLAKILHPDLEQDIERKAYKELRMRELTAAYEKNDLHTLLRLELEWLHKEETNIAQLTDEKLNIYNEVLKVQAADLEAESYTMLQHPRYQPLLRFVMLPKQLRTLNLSQKKKDMDKTLKSLEKSILRLEGNDALEEIKETIEYFRQYY